jgi:hypothetical protein
MNNKAIILGDLVKSRTLKIPDVSRILISLKKKYSEINHRLLHNKGSFEIFRGDSFQAFIPEPEKAVLISIIIRAWLRTFEPSENKRKIKRNKPILYAYSDARIAIGIGAISYIANSLAESHGEAFEKSGYAFDDLKKNKNRLMISTPWVEINKELKVECKLADAIISKWTPSTSEAMYYYLLYNSNQEKLAKILKISQPGVHKRITTYGNAGSIKLFLKRNTELITRGNINGDIKF